MNKKYEHIIWDWNGTLLNDIEICIKSMNHLLGERNLPLLNEKVYREVFTFPVKNYYKEIGFDFATESFEIPALQFIDYYTNYLSAAALYPEVKQVLQHYKNQKLNQFILSAMEQNSLEKSVFNLDISTFFNKIYGISDHFARSKVVRGLQLIKSEKLDPRKTLMVGDTIHDVEVAASLGIDCVLVSQGHYAEYRLKINGNKVIQHLIELKDIL